MTRPISAALLAIAGLAFVLGGACSTETSNSDAGATGGHAGGTGGSTGAGGSPGCASAVLNGSCSTDNTTCSSGCTDACSFCNVLRCSGGHWVQQESVPAPCFDCGPTLRCRTGMQACYKTTGGAATNPPSYACADLPQQCLATPTCACVAPPPAMCEESGTGQLTITFAAP